MTSNALAEEFLARFPNKEDAVDGLVDEVRKLHADAKQFRFQLEYTEMLFPDALDYGTEKAVWDAVVSELGQALDAVSRIERDYEQ